MAFFPRWGAGLTLSLSMLFGTGVDAFEPNAAVALEFTGAGRYRVGPGSYASPYFAALPGLSVTRASPGYAETTAGLLVPFSAGQARITDKGLLVEEARTNKCGNSNLNPANSLNMTKGGDAASTFTRVDDSAALAAIGLTGNVFKLDNSLGVTQASVAISGTAANTNVHTCSAYMRGSGTAQVRIQGTTNTPVAITSTYARYTRTEAPPLSSNVMAVYAEAGSVVYFILNDLEEGAFATSPIAVAGAAATRAADVIALYLAAPLAAPFTYSASGSLAALDGTDRYLVSLSPNPPDGVNLTHLRRTSTNSARINVTSSSVGVSADPATGLTGAFRLRMAGRIRATDYAATANASAMVGAAKAAPTGLNVIWLGCNSAGPNSLNGYLERLIIEGDTTDAQFLARAA